MSKKISVVLGVGARAGLGASVSLRAAQDGHHVVVVGRTQEKLDKIVDEIKGAGGSAVGHAVDVTEARDVAGLFANIDAMDGELDFVCYNVGNAFIHDTLSMSADFFEQAWRACCLGGFLTAKEAGRRLVARGAGTMVFTGATASLRARSPFLAFASAKAALRAVAAAFARELGPKGVHVAHVIVDGVIDGEMINKRVPDLKDKLGQEGMLDPAAIADAYWQLHEQHPSAWTFELDLRPAVEGF